MFLREKGEKPTLSLEENVKIRSQIFHDVLPHPKYYGELNAFSLEIIAMRDDMKSHWPRDFLEGAFACFPDLDYCVILLPSFHPCQSFLQYFVVPNEIIIAYLSRNLLSITNAISLILILARTVEM